MCCSRSTAARIEAQIEQVEGQLARDNAQLDGAERDVRRYTELVAKSATPVTNLDNAKTQERVFAAAIKADEAQLENLQRAAELLHDRCADRRTHQHRERQGRQFRALRRSGAARHASSRSRRSMSRFPVPQNNLPELRKALAAGDATIEVTIPGETRSAHGQVTMIENTVDRRRPAWSTVRATMPNDGRAAVARHARDRAA